MTIIMVFISRKFTIPNRSKVVDRSNTPLYYSPNFTLYDTSLWSKAWRWKIWNFIVIIRLLNQIKKWVRGFIRSFINPFDNFGIFSKLTTFFNGTKMSIVLRFTQSHFMKRRWIINKRVIKDKLVIVEIIITIRVKDLVTNIIRLGIIASAKHSFKQVINN